MIGLFECFTLIFLVVGLVVVILFLSAISGNNKSNNEVEYKTKSKRVKFDNAYIQIDVEEELWGINTFDEEEE
jgi:competence protein ComGC